MLRPDNIGLRLFCIIQPMTDKNIYPGVRLGACAEYLRGVPLFDVGTDHCLLPIYAVSRLGVPFAVASDVVDGPVETARKAVGTAGLEDVIEVVKADGLDGTVLPVPCDVVIAGMGGELIKNILSRKPELKEEGVRLILQPMTKKAELRDYLTGNGFEIISETVCFDGKYYSIICASYTGVNTALSSAEKEVGRASVQTDRAKYAEYRFLKAEELEKAVRGKKLGGIDTSADEKLIEELRRT